MPDVANNLNNNGPANTQTLTMLDAPTLFNNAGTRGRTSTLQDFHCQHESLHSTVQEDSVWEGVWFEQETSPEQTSIEPGYTTV